MIKHTLGQTKGERSSTNQPKMHAADVSERRGITTHPHRPLSCVTSKREMFKTNFVSSFLTEKRGSDEEQSHVVAFPSFNVASH